MADLIRCVRAHGMTMADWVIPPRPRPFRPGAAGVHPERVASVRLSFPDGPVSSLDDVRVSVRAALTCRCHAGPGHGQIPRTCDGRR
jgi:hypothetical protein